MLQISLPRGDLKTVPFIVRHKDKTPDDGSFTEIYMTVKRTFNDKKFLIQKMLGDGSIVSLGDGAYSFTFEPEDTDNLSFGKYVFDIELIRSEGDKVKQTFAGELVILPEATHSTNETVVDTPNENEPDNGDNPDDGNEPDPDNPDNGDDPDGE